MRITRGQLREIIDEVIVRGVLDVTPSENGDLEFKSPSHPDWSATYSLKASNTGIPGVNKADIEVTDISYSGEEGSNERLTVTANAKATVLGVTLNKPVSDDLSSETIEGIINAVNDEATTFEFTGDSGTITGTLAESLMKKIISEECAAGLSDRFAQEAGAKAAALSSASSLSDVLGQGGTHVQDQLLSRIYTALLRIARLAQGRTISGRYEDALDEFEIEPPTVEDAWYPEEVTPAEGAWSGGDNLEDPLDHIKFETGESNAGPHVTMYEIYTRSIV